MPNLYTDADNTVTRAVQVWPILAMLAHERKTMRYGDLAQIIGTHHRPLRYILGHIMTYCQKQGLPALTVLVVNAETGRPGVGLTKWLSGGHS